MPFMASRKGQQNMENDDKLPRGHAYIRMRNNGGYIHIDYPEVDSPEAERMIKAVLAVLKEFANQEQEADHAD